MKARIVFLIAIILAAMAVGILQPRANALVTGRTYTTDADFDEGILAGVEHTTVHDQLQLSKSITTFPFIWVPNNEGTVSKVDTRTGREVGRYWVSAGGDSSPSRTTVDLQGNCWVGCRQRGTVVKIGLYEAGQWIDRNGDGICQTSNDTNGDGNIEGSEILPWGQDECVLYEVVLISGSEGTFVPGTYPGAYDTNYWGTSPRGLAIDARDNLWAGTWSSRKYYHINGTSGAIISSVNVSPHNAYGAVLDKNGILWSAEGPGGDQPNIILRLDTATNAISFLDLGHTCYGLGLDYSNHMWVSSYWNSKMSRVDILANPPTFVTYNVPEQAESRGVTATNDDNVWVANTGANTVTRYDNNGNLLTTITGLAGPTGVSVDADGKVWATNNYDENISRIDPATNTIDLSKQITGSGGHYSYSDMTGIVARTITTRIGTWAVIFDSQAPDTPWEIVSWHSMEPAGTSVTVKVRSTNDKIAWSPWETVANGTLLSTTPDGRYLQIETTLQIMTGEVSPILYDLTVEVGIIHDVAVTNIVVVVPHCSSKVGNDLWVFQGLPVYVNVTVLNKGDFSDIVTVTLYYNITDNKIIGIQSITIPVGESRTLSFVWDTGIVPYCHNYTLTAVAAIPADFTSADNTLDNVYIKVRIMGDLNGDGKVDGKDLTLVAWSFASYGPDYLYPGSPPHPKWNLDSDINLDSKIDGKDLTLVARNFGMLSTS